MKKKTVWVLFNSYEYGQSIYLFTTRLKTLKFACQIIKETSNIVTDDDKQTHLQRLLDNKDYKKIVNYWNSLKLDDYFEIEEKEIL